MAGHVRRRLRSPGEDLALGKGERPGASPCGRWLRTAAAEKAVRDAPDLVGQVRGAQPDRCAHVGQSLLENLMI